MFNKYGISEKEARKVSSIFYERSGNTSTTCEVMTADSLIQKYGIYIPKYVMYKIEGSHLSEKFMWYSKVGI